jgi:hypothetical protein
MRRIVAIVPVVLAVLFLAPWAGSAAAPKDVAKHPSCKYCGMIRGKLAHSRFLIEYDDGSSVGLCSLHCAAVELALVFDKVPKALRVGDYVSGLLIDAETAQWVIGGDRQGVMTNRAKWAFRAGEDAEAFVQAHGGEKASFEQAIRAAYEDMYRDAERIRDRRKMRRMKEEGHGGHQH